MGARGTGAPESFIVNLGSPTAARASAARFTVPGLPDGEGIIVRSITMRGGAEIGDGADIDIDVLNQTTSMLSAAVTMTGTATRTATLANDGQELVEAGRYIAINVADGGLLTANTYMDDVVIQVDFDRLGRHTGGGVR